MKNRFLHVCLAVLIVLFFGCSTSSDGNGNSTDSLPVVTTTAVSGLTTTAATTGGTINSDGGSAVTARGVCWSTSTNPTIAISTKTSDGAGMGTFASNITGLTANTTYYVRAYATNSVGTAYGNEITFTTLQNSTAINLPGPNVTDIDGNTYNSVTNCGLTFTKQNLNVSKYSDGTPIPQVTDPSQWANLTTGAWCYYNNTTANGTTYGKLYNWYAVVGIYNAASAANPTLRKKLAPTGWHIPTDTEWSSLINCLDPNADGSNNTNVAGGKMKSIGTIQAGTGLWNDPNTAATNESGFSGLPAGYRSSLGSFNSSLSYYGNWWSSAEFSTGSAWISELNFADAIAAIFNYGGKVCGFSVRCVKD